MSVRSLDRYGTLIDLEALPYGHLVNVSRIAHNLSQINRSAGCFDHPVSVATHSVIVSLLCPPSVALIGLLHDCTEADTGDLKRPIKQMCPEYRALERKVWAQYAAALHLPTEIPLSVEAADSRAWELELVTLTRAWPYPDRLRPEFSAAERAIARDLLEKEIPWRESKRLFLERYEQATSRASQVLRYRAR